MAGPAAPAAPLAIAKGRCRCGHLPTHHMLVRPIASLGGFRLVPAGSCQVCGEAVCRRYVAVGGGEAPAPLSRTLRG